MDKLFSRDIDFLIEEFSSGSAGALGLAELGRLLSEAKVDDIQSVLNIELPEHCDKYTQDNVENGIGRLSRYLELLKAEASDLDQLNTQYYNESVVGKEQIQKLQAQLKEKLAAISIYRKSGTKELILRAGDQEKWEEGTPGRLVVIDNTDYAVLPISGNADIPILKLSVSQDSNGSPGDPRNLDKAYAADDLNALKDNNPLTRFEYSRPGLEPCLLKLDVRLNRSDVVNAVSISCAEYPWLEYPRLEAIYAQIGNESVVAHGPMDLKEDNYLLIEPLISEQWLIVLSSRGTDSIRSTSGLINRSLIGIRDIGFHQLTFQQTGDLYSKAIPSSSFSLVSLGSIDPEESKVSVQDINGSWIPLGDLKGTDDFAKVGNTLRAKVSLQVGNNTNLKPTKEIGVRASGRAMFQKSYLMDKILGAVEESGIYVGYKNLIHKSSVDREYIKLALPKVLSGTNAQDLEVCADGEPVEFNLFESDGQTYINIAQNASRNMDVRPKEEHLLLMLSGGVLSAQTNRVPVPRASEFKARAISGINNKVIAIQKHETVYRNAFPLKGVSFFTRVDGIEQASPYTEDLLVVTAPTVDPVHYMVDYEHGVVYLPTDRDSVVYMKIKEVLTKEIPVKSMEIGGQSKVFFHNSDIPSFSISESISSTSRRSATYAIGSNFVNYPDQVMHKSGQVIYLSYGCVSNVKLSDLTYGEVPFIDGYQELEKGTLVKYQLGLPLPALFFYKWKLNASITDPDIIPCSPNFLSRKTTLAEVTEYGDWCLTSDNEIIARLEASESLEIGVFKNDNKSYLPYSVDAKRGAIYFKQAPTIVDISYVIRPVMAKYQIGIQRPVSVDRNLISVDGVGQDVKVNLYYNESSQNIGQNFYSPRFTSLKLLGA